MASNAVLNHFGNAESGDDNELVLDGVVSGTTWDAAINVAGSIHLSAFMTDANNSAVGGRAWVIPGFAGTIAKFSMVCASGGAGDPEFTLLIDNDLVAGSTITIDASRGATFFTEPTGDNAFSDTQAIEITTDGNVGNSLPMYFTFELIPDPV